MLWFFCFFFFLFLNALLLEHFCWAAGIFPLYAWPERSPEGSSLFLLPVRLPWHQERWPQFLLCKRVESGRSWTSSPPANGIRQACRRPSHIQGRPSCSWATHKPSLEPKWLQKSHNKWRNNQYGSKCTQAQPYARGKISGLEKIWLRKNSAFDMVLRDTLLHKDAYSSMIFVLLLAYVLFVLVRILSRCPSSRTPTAPQCTEINTAK